MIFINANDSPTTVRDHESTLDQDCPMNWEWHEFAYYVMDETWPGIPQLAEGDTNHAGQENASTTDPWVEGWAAFWPTALKAFEGSQNPTMYADIADLEFNWNAVNFRGDLSQEDMAVASLMLGRIRNGAGWPGRTGEGCGFADPTPHEGKGPSRTSCW